MVVQHIIIRNVRGLNDCLVVLWPILSGENCSVRGAMDGGLGLAGKTISTAKKYKCSKSQSAIKAVNSVDFAV